MNVRRPLSVAALAALLLVAMAGPASAQQIVDSAHEGGRAFVGLSIMIFVFVAILFAFDKVRQKAEDEDDARRR